LRGSLEVTISIQSPSAGNIIAFPEVGGMPPCRWHLTVISKSRKIACSLELGDQIGLLELRDRAEHLPHWALIASFVNDY
jgi:hypothetical protein